MDWPLLVAVVAVFASIQTAISSSIRNEAHHQAAIIQDLIKEISEISHRHCESSLKPQDSTEENLQFMALSFEVLCDLKCNQLESVFELLIRRCSRRFLFDANSHDFKPEFTALVGVLRNHLSLISKDGAANNENMYKTHAMLQNIYSRLNAYIGERFRPLIE